MRGWIYRHLMDGTKLASIELERDAVVSWKETRATIDHGAEHQTIADAQSSRFQCPVAPPVGSSPTEMARRSSDVHLEVRNPRYETIKSIKGVSRLFWVFCVNSSTRRIGVANRGATRDPTISAWRAL